MLVNSFIQRPATIEEFQRLLHVVRLLRVDTKARAAGKSIVTILDYFLLHCIFLEKGRRNDATVAAFALDVGNEWPVARSDRLWLLPPSLAELSHRHQEYLLRAQSIGRSADAFEGLKNHPAVRAFVRAPYGAKTRRAFRTLMEDESTRSYVSMVSFVADFEQTIMPGYRDMIAFLKSDPRIIREEETFLSSLNARQLLADRETALSVLSGLEQVRPDRKGPNSADANVYATCVWLNRASRNAGGRSVFRNATDGRIVPTLIGTNGWMELDRDYSACRTVHALAVERTFMGHKRLGTKEFGERLMDAEQKLRGLLAAPSGVSTGETFWAKEEIRRDLVSDVLAGVKKEIGLWGGSFMFRDDLDAEDETLGDRGLKGIDELASTLAEFGNSGDAALRQRVTGVELSLQRIQREMLEAIDETMKWKEGLRESIKRFEGTLKDWCGEIETLLLDVRQLVESFLEGRSSEDQLLTATRDAMRGKEGEVARAALLTLVERLVEQLKPERKWRELEVIDGSLRRVVDGSCRKGE